MIYHYTLKFKGSINRTFKFDVRDTHNPLDWEEGIYNDLHEYVTEKSDGYLYIQGCRITNNKEGIRTIYQNLSYNSSRNVESGYVDSNFTIDGSGYIICTYHYYGTNQADRWMDKFMHRFG
jgi:hypothetical protein